MGKPSLASRVMADIFLPFRLVTVDQLAEVRVAIDQKQSECMVSHRFKGGAMTICPMCGGARVGETL